ncbi:MAG: agmatine deiminase family protein, partial [Ignavibacterium sp.]|nr:agmatine deiminase family protein [Ignavibacterium sp.]
PPSGDYRTYTNSIIVNKTVIVPTYELQYDTSALRIYREAMPGYRVVGINCNSIIPSLGAIHCITKEVGVYEPVYISHPKISGEIVSADPIEVKAFIKTKSGISNTSVYWTTDTTQSFSAIPMISISVDTFTAFIPVQPNGTEVFYYISAVANNGRTVTKPLTAPEGYYHFKVSNTVPVELLSFTASSIENTVTLNWDTATETNNSGFEVQRLKDSKIEKIKNWKSIGFINGHGTTTESKSYSFTDKDLTEGKYRYRLKQIDFDGSFEYSEIVEANIALTEFKLEQNYPNPFNPSTKISWQSPVGSWQTLKVFDVLGKEVATLVNEYKDAGSYEVEFSPASSIKNLTSGIYFYQLKAGEFHETKKMLLIK